jgi:hypothetical protein
VCLGEVLKMSDEENVNIYFVVPKGLKNENLCSDDMKMAFQVRMLFAFTYLIITSQEYCAVHTFYKYNSLTMSLSRVVWNMSCHQSGS